MMKLTLKNRLLLTSTACTLLVVAAFLVADQIAANARISGLAGRLQQLVGNFRL